MHKSYAHICANVQICKKIKKTLYKTKVMKYNSSIK